MESVMKIYALNAERESYKPENALKWLNIPYTSIVIGREPYEEGGPDTWQNCAADIDNIPTCPDDIIIASPKQFADPDTNWDGNMTERAIKILSPKFKKVITVDEKHTYGSSNSKGSQSISDTDNNVYILKDSLYVWHWTSVEVFNKLDIGNKYNIEGHGIRVPFLRWFPNITKATLIK